MSLTVEVKYMGYKFAQFDPRPQGTEANAEIFENATGVLGVEVTIPALAAKCSLGNLDHHGPSDTADTPSACEQALLAARPPDGATLATVRPDADSVTAMAILALRSLASAEVREADMGDLLFGCDPEGWKAGERIKEIVAAVGRFDRLGPSAGRPDNRVIAVARVAEDSRRSLEERVIWVRDILVGEQNPDEIYALVAERDAEFDAARAASELHLEADGRISAVVSTHRFATNLGYESAPVVVAYNPEMPVDFRDPSKGSYKKFTVCRYDSHTPCDLPAALSELQALEEGWGGRGDIFSSPQGVSSTLTLDQVVEVVTRHLV